MLLRRKIGSQNCIIIQLKKSILHIMHITFQLILYNVVLNQNLIKYYKCNLYIKSNLIKLQKSNICI